MESAFFRDDIPNDGKVQRFSETAQIPAFLAIRTPPPACAASRARAARRGPVAVGRDVPIAPPRHCPCPIARSRGAVPWR